MLGTANKRSNLSGIYKNNTRGHGRSIKLLGRDEELMKLTILESPYAGATPEIQERNILYARECLKHSLMLDEATIASHLLHTQVLDDTIYEERTLGIQAGTAWIEVADQMVFYCDYGMSPGMNEAKAQAKAAGLKVVYRTIHADS